MLREITFAIVLLAGAATFTFGVADILGHGAAAMVGSVLAVGWTWVALQSTTSRTEIDE